MYYLDSQAQLDCCIEDREYVSGWILSRTLSISIPIQGRHSGIALWTMNDPRTSPEVLQETYTN